MDLFTLIDKLKNTAMKKIFILSLICLATITACRINLDLDNEGKGPIIDKAYTQFKFCKIEQSNGIESEVFKSTENKVIVTAPDDIIDKIIVESTETNQVKIHVKSNSNISTKHVKVKIYTSQICEINSSSASEVKVRDSFSEAELNLKSSSGSEIEGNFVAIKIQINASSGSHIKADIQAKDAVINTSSGGEIDLAGFTKTCDGKASSGGQINGEKFKISEASLNASSGGKIDISITEKANANASSGGEINFIRAGNNINLIKKESSGGEVHLK